MLRAISGIASPSTRSHTAIIESVQPPVERITQRIQLGFDYPVVFTHDLLDPANEDLWWCLNVLPRGRQPQRIFTVVDDGVAGTRPELLDRWRAYFSPRASEVEPCATPLVIPGGEAAKNDPDLVPRLWSAFAKAKLDRHAVVVAIGGGAVLDAVGFAAATAHRGIRLLRIPTTVLAQNDAGIGVKNGINVGGIKNFAGTFAPPMAVLCDDVWLPTLPLRARRSGLAEAVKVALIRDGAFFSWIDHHRHDLAHAEPAVERAMIRRCAELHLEHIASSGDPFETGSARPLDFGHWAAHKLEQLTHHELLHGEAVAIGMAVDLCLAEDLGWLPKPTVESVLDVLRALGLPIWHDILRACDASGRRRIFEGVEEFREHIGGALDITLVTGIGRARSLDTLDESRVEAAIARLADRCSV